MLLQQCGWVKAKGGRLVPTPAGRSLLESFTPERLREGLGTWVADNEAYRVLQALGLNCRVAEDTEGLYVGDAHYGSLVYYPGSVGRVYFRQTVCESLATLGIVDLAYLHPYSRAPDFDHEYCSFEVQYMTAYDGVQYLRLTPLGRYCLGLDTAYELPEPEARALFKVLPNLDVVVTNPAAFSAADAAQVARFADPTSDAVWRIGADSVLRALEAGDTAENILAVLRAGSDVALPPTLEALLHDTAARAGAAVDREPGLLVTFRDAETAALVANDTAASKAISSHDGTVVAVRERNLKAFRSALRNLGILLP